MPKRAFEAWTDPADNSITLGAPEEIRRQIETGILSAQARKLFAFEAASHEEAMAIFSVRVGYGPYTPVGEPAPCPECGAQYWPEGSAECWQCGHLG